MRACMLSPFSHVQLFATPRTVSHQDPLSMWFSKQEYWMGCHSLLQGVLYLSGKIEIDIFIWTIFINKLFVSIVYKYIIFQYNILLQKLHQSEWYHRIRRKIRKLPSITSLNSVTETIKISRYLPLTHSSSWCARMCPCPLTHSSSWCARMCPWEVVAIFHYLQWVF